MELAEWHIRTGRLQIATIGLQESPNRSAARTSLLGRISQKYALRGMPDSALLVLQSIESSSDRMDEMFLTADTCAVNGEKEFAQQLLARALKSKVGEKAYLSSETIRVAVETSIAIGDESFVEVLDSLLVYGYDLAIALTEESDSLLVKNERDKGIRCLRATTKVTLSLGHDRFGDPWWDDNWRNVADLYIRVGYYPEVFGLLENPLISERTSLCAKILTDLGVAYSRKGLDLSDVEKGTLHRLIEHIVN